jgi:hypothetical protein
MIQIFKWFNGTNDIKAVKPLPGAALSKSGNWSFEALNLFRNCEYLNFIKKYQQ